ncbi:MAG: tyrosine-protein phosphatase [Oscillospiraceae bacterium]|nr:tyrosine-protein phosphatase [Oscillospiraceae bacterium]
MSRRIPMEKLPNTRDLGGMIGYGGRTVREGLLIRSGQLAEATPADLADLERRIELVVDFRNLDEHVNVPDPEMPGVAQIHLPILEGQGPGVAQDERSRRAAMTSLFEDPEKPKAVMKRIYEDFVARPYCRGKYREFLMLLDEDRKKAVLWHCAAGKDRAGFASVLVQELLGVSREDIFEDYLATNVYLEQVIEKMTEDHARLTGLTDRAHREAMGYMFGARIELIQAVYDRTEELYGGFEGLFTEGMRIPREQIERMRERFLA